MDRCDEAKSPQIDLLNWNQFIIHQKKVKNEEKSFPEEQRQN